MLFVTEKLRINYLLQLFFCLIMRCDAVQTFPRMWCVLCKQFCYCINGVLHDRDFLFLFLHFSKTAQKATTRFSIACTQVQALYDDFAECFWLQEVNNIEFLYGLCSALTVTCPTYIYPSYKNYHRFDLEKLNSFLTKYIYPHQ